MATLVDLQPLMIICYVTIPEGERTYEKFRHNFFDRIFGRILDFTRQFGAVILCGEGGRSWRKDVYPEYKANRHKVEKTDEEQADSDQMFEWFNKLIGEIEDNKVFRILRADGAEADDVIGLLAYNASEPTLIFSADKDFQQCQVNENVKQWSNVKGGFLKCDDPRDFLVEHIVRGDSTDNIPSIRKELYQEGVPKDKARLPITSRWMSDFKNGVNYEKYSKRYEENKKLIDIREMPADVKMRIVDEVGKEWKRDVNLAIAYFKDNGMGRFAEEYILYRK